ncbi:MAG: metalloregulator ArsR/SmtB family transcription factor [Gammaproteobacteria bacterium]
METDTAVETLAALAQGTRLAIVRYLVRMGPEGVSASRIGKKLDVAAATLSFHLKELARAGVVIPRHEGRFIYYAVDYAAINELVGFLTENCCRGEEAADCAPPAGEEQ